MTLTRTEAARTGPNTQHKALYRRTICTYPGTSHENTDQWFRYDGGHWVCERCRGVELGEGPWVDVYIDLRKVEENT